MTQKAFSGRALAAGMAAASLMALAGTAEAQQAYYFPQAGNGPVTVNYSALNPYAAPGYPVPGYQPYGTPGAQPQSVFTPQGAAPAYAAPVYGTPAYQPVYAAPSSQFLPGQVTTGPAGRPAAVSPITYNAPIPQAPFVAPYANPYTPQQAGLGYPGAPQSYLNVPGQAPVALIGTPQPGAKPFDPNFARKTTRKVVPSEAASTDAVEQAAAAQVAAVEAQLESGPPTPPAPPSEVPASVPSPAETAAGAIAAAPAPAAAEAQATPAAPAAEEPVSEAAPAEPATIEPPAEGETQTASVEPAAEAEAPAEDAAAAALPAGSARLVFDPGADDLPAGANGELDAIADRMMADDSIKVQVLAYSSASGENESQARRKALSRGLEVRKYLINKGVRSNRIDVRALGSKSEGGPADRVDIVPSAG